MADAKSIGAGVGGVVGTVFGPAGTAVGTAAGSFVGGLFGNSEPEVGASGTCPNQPSTQTVQAVFARATPAEVAELQRMWQAGIADMGEAFPTSAQRFAWHIAGGNDCKVTTVTGKAVVAYFNQLVAKYSPAVGEFSGSLSPQATGTAQQMDATGLGGQIKSIGENLWNTAKQIATATVSGAVAGAQASTTGASAGAQAGTIATQNALPLLLFGGLGLVAVLLLTRK